MLECYSTNVTVDTNTPIPLNSIAVRKCNSIDKSGVSSVQFNHCGAYKVTVSAFAIAETTPEAGSVISMQLSKDGVLQPQAQSQETVTDNTSYHTLGFSTIVQVPTNNSCCACVAPVIIDVVNTGVAATYHLDVVIERI